MEGSRELIEDLREAEARVVLASSAKDWEVDHYLDLLDARDLVDGWTTSRGRGADRSRSRTWSPPRSRRSAGTDRRS